MSQYLIFNLKKNTLNLGNSRLLWRQTYKYYTRISACIFMSDKYFYFIFSC